ncbi:hypothetical protein SAMN05216377_13517 [Pseudonocardia oroxyli]|uniref:Uncharacterized protein n=1 Tax=Pseudonocardia oroxyli TaxID=366584 RepID=A0A1G8EFT3_PSEOR|nr:hypothetical protein SAMN05216377_13517 [Pseudonocardia oroxyli]
MLRRTPGVALTVDVCDVCDVCDVASGLVRQVIARGRGEIVPFGVDRGRRKLARYLGPDESLWDTRFRDYLSAGPAGRGAVWLRIHPERITATDLSYRVPLSRPDRGDLGCGGVGDTAAERP